MLDVSPLLLRWQEAGLEASAHKVTYLLSTDVLGFYQVRKVAVQVASKVGWVVRVDGHAQPAPQQLAQTLLQLAIIHLELRSRIELSAASAHTAPAGHYTS